MPPLAELWNLLFICVPAAGHKQTFSQALDVYCWCCTGSRYRKHLSL